MCPALSCYNFLEFLQTDKIFGISVYRIHSQHQPSQQRVQYSTNYIYSLPSRFMQRVEILAKNSLIPSVNRS